MIFIFKYFGGKKWLLNGLLQEYRKKFQERRVHSISETVDLIQMQNTIQDAHMWTVTIPGKITSKRQ